MRARRTTQINAADTTPPHPGRLIGYARVSTSDQSNEQQVDALLAAGVHPDNIHTDTVSGSRSRRPGLDLALKDCVPGDTLIVWRLDRLGRNLLHLLTTIDTLAKRGVSFRSITNGFDTSTPQGRLMMQLLGMVAEFERALIAERTSENIRAKVAKGTLKPGPKHKIDTDIAEQMFRDGASVADVCARFNLSSRSTVYSYFTSAEMDELRQKGAEARKRAARRKR